MGEALGGDSRFGGQPLAGGKDQHLAVSRGQHVDGVFHPLQVLLHHRVLHVLGEEGRLGVAAGQVHPGAAPPAPGLDDQRIAPERPFPVVPGRHRARRGDAQGPEGLVHAQLVGAHRQGPGAGEQEPGAQGLEAVPVLPADRQLFVQGRQEQVHRLAPAHLQHAFQVARGAHPGHHVGGVGEVETHRSRVAVRGDDAAAQGLERPVLGHRGRGSGGGAQEGQRVGMAGWLGHGFNLGHRVAGPRSGGRRGRTGRGPRSRPGPGVPPGPGSAPAPVPCAGSGTGRAAWRSPA